MLEIDTNIGIFKKKEIFFADNPFDVDGYDLIVFYACPNKPKVKGFFSNVTITSVIDLNQSIGLIWKKMDKGSCRWSIKSAIKKGVKIKINQEYDTFLQINYSFRKEKGLGDNIFITPEFMRKNGTLFIAELDGKMLGGQFYLKDDKHMHWTLGASKRLESDTKTAMIIGHSNRLMVWEAIRYAKGNGYQEFDLGGYIMSANKWNQRYGSNFFKKSFGGKLVKKYVHKKYYSSIYRGSEYVYQITKKLPSIFKILFPALQKTMFKETIWWY